MKKIMIFLIAAAFSAGVHAQDKKCCCEKKGTAMRQHHSKPYHAALKTTKPPAFTNRVHNTEAEEAPGTYHGNDVWRYEYSTKINDKDRLEMNSENTYTGGYPKPTPQYTKVSEAEIRAAGKNHGHSDLCLWGCR